MKLFKDLPNTDTPINAENLNQIKDKLVVVSLTEPTGDDREEVWIKRGKNRFNKNIAIAGWITGAGVTGDSAVTMRTNKMKVKANISYIFSFDYETLASVSNREYCLYDNNYNVLTVAGTNYTVTDKHFIIKPTVDGYIDISYDVNCKNVMFEQNIEKTAYEEYIEPKIYLKNNNNVYEEFMKKEEDTGWILLTVGENVTNFSWMPLAYRKVGKTVYIHGGCTIDTSISKEIAQLPNDCLPRKGFQEACVYNAGTSMINISISTTGLISFVATNRADVTKLDFTINTSYLTD